MSAPPASDLSPAGCTAPAVGGACAGRQYLERGVPVVVVCGWAGPGPRNVLIERVDGSRVVRPFRGLRRMQQQKA